MSDDRYSAPIPKWLSVAVGFVCALIGVPLVAFCVVGVIGLLTRPSPESAIVIVSVALTVGLFMSVMGIRLLRNKARPDGGLVSPWVLRLGGAFFVVVPVLMALEHRSLPSIWHIVGLMSAGIACFALANRREHNRG